MDRLFQEFLLGIPAQTSYSRKISTRSTGEITQRILEDCKKATGSFQMECLADSQKEFLKDS